MTAIILSIIALVGALLCVFVVTYTEYRIKRWCRGKIHKQKHAIQELLQRVEEINSLLSKLQTYTDSAYGKLLAELEFVQREMLTLKRMKQQLTNTSDYPQTHLNIPEGDDSPAEMAEKIMAKAAKKNRSNINETRL